MSFRVQLLKTGQNDDLAARIWTDGEPRNGVIIVVHGLGDHSERFSSLARELTARGWGVMAFDLPGHGVSRHGTSAGRRGSVGRYENVLADIAAARRSAADRLPGYRHVLLGHSMGGNLALNYVLRQNEWRDVIGDPVRRLVLLAPMILPPNPPPRPIIFAAWLTGNVLPWIRIRRNVDLAHLSRDWDELEKIRSDKLMHSRISLYLATQLLSQGRWAIDHIHEMNVPTLISYGQSDTMIDRSACEHLAIRIGELATLATWPEMQHDLLHDLDREQVIEHLADWLDSSVSASPESDE